MKRRSRYLEAKCQTQVSKLVLRLSLQDFMKVYKVLTDELLADDLIAGQPTFSADYMRRVNTTP
jgi:hypothetical protein